MLRCASSLVVAAYAKVRLTPRVSRALPAAFLRSRPQFKAFNGFLRERQTCQSAARRLAGSAPGHQPVISIPIDLAVPATILTAPSISTALRSLYFSSAMSLTCLAVIVPTFSRLGSPEPLAIFAACFKSTEAGGVLVTKVNDRSA